MAAPITAVQFFEHPAVQFPLERDTDDFEAFVRSRLQGYVDLIRGMDAADSITKQIKGEVDRIETLCRLLLQAIGEYMRGLPHKAYACLHKGIQTITDGFSRLIGDVNHPFMRELYRMRKEQEPGVTFEKPDLFHIPFQLRHKVSRQRYSIPGLPCLYLGGSLYICWEELRRPKFESIHVARFEAAGGRRVAVLDFMQRPLHNAHLIRSNTSGANEIPLLRNGYCSMAMCWPLMATAAIRRRHGDAPFIAEYIIPQLILQWITENNDPDLDGIAYSSVNCKTHVSYPPTLVNLVFPAKEITDSGYCSRLRSKFAMTNPVPWNILARVDHPFKMPLSGSAMIEFIPGRQSEYFNSEFCAVGGKLLTMSAAAL